MTADAKVGLLLGLVFIVMIAFLINGLPNFLQTANADNAVDVTIKMPTDREDLVINEGRLAQTAAALQRQDSGLRRTTPPQDEIVLDDPPTVLAYQPQPAPVEPLAPVLPVQPAPVAVRTHVVKPYENLAKIAQQYYGKEEGNRHAVIQRLFEANQDVLPSPDKVRVGQKLTIPPMEILMTCTVADLTAASEPVSEKNGSSFKEKLSNFFERSDREPAATVHVVQEGESLWGIAQMTLGNGKRYKEILELNSATIKNPNDVVVGMRLKIPTP